MWDPVPTAHVVCMGVAFLPISEVNAWIERGTNGLIKNAIPDGSVNEKTRIILGNALYFKATWNESFSKNLTTKSPFYLLDGTSVRVPFMSSFMDPFVSSFDGFKVLKLPYKPGNDERRFSMYIFLPSQIDGLPSLIEKIGSDMGFLDRHLPNRRVRLGEFMVPRFKFSFGFEATEMLQKLGVLSLFSPTEAELTGMVVEGSPLGGRLHVSSILHRALIEVNEEGTEAAAATTMFTGAACPCHSTAMDFVADHPFLFMVREDVNGVVLFTGHVLNPSTMG